MSERRNAIKDRGGARGEGKTGVCVFSSFLSSNDMYAGDSHLFGGSFQTVETMLLHSATIAPV